MPSPLLLGGVFEIGKTIIDKVFPDPEKKAQAELELLRLTQEREFKELDAELQMALAQVEVNKVEAQSDDFFKSGWRPAVGWVCVSGLGYQYVVSPLATGIFTNFIVDFKPLPSLDLSELMPLLIGLLGLGVYRTVEKVKSLKGK